MGGYGVAVVSSTNDLIKNNTLRMMGTGIEIQQSSSMTILNNMVADCNYSGIHLNLSLRNILVQTLSTATA